MKNIKYYIIFAFCSVCIIGFAQENETKNFSEFISINNLQQHILALTADSLEGRETGSDGAFMAAEYIASQFKKIGLQAPEYDSYYVPFSTTKLYGINLIGIIEGSSLKDQIIIVSAHYDHLGTFNGNVYPGADDNASGVSAMIEIAKAFKDKGYKPLRTIVFIAFDAKEQELSGSAYYAARPLYPLSNTMVNLNIDAIGRIEGSPNGRADYLFLVGTDRLSSDLSSISDDVNRANNLNLFLDYSFYNSEIFSEVFYTFSDQYNFGKRNIPVIYYTGGLHDDLYKSTDTENLINYEALKKRTELIFYTAWEMANRPNRLKIDLNKK